MTFQQARLDHVVLDTRDGMDDAVRAWRTLGFQLTDRSRHSLGSINHLAVLEPAYIELLGFDAASNAVRADIAAFPAGLNGLVFGTDSAAQLFGQLKARNVLVEEPVDFSRVVNLPDGPAEARFRVVRFPKDTFPFGRVYFCQHFTPNLIWRPEWLRHASGATGIERISIAVRNPWESAQQFTPIFGPEHVQESHGGAWTVIAGAIGIEFLPASVLERELGSAMPLAHGRSDFAAKLSIQTSSLSRAADTLRVASVRFTEPQAGRILIPASDAGNIALEFVEAA